MQQLLDFLCNSRVCRESAFDNGKIEKYVVILKNGRHMQYLNSLETELIEGDNIAMFPPVAGG